jgi:hypothetical protein
VLATAARAATATGRWAVANERPVPLEWFQGLTHGFGGDSRFFVGVFEGVTRTDAGLEQQLRNPAVIPPAIKARYGFNHIGDPTFDRRGGGRILLPLECYTPGASNDGNTCGRGGIGVLDPVTLQWRRLILLDARDIRKAMWAEMSPDGRLLWTSSGPSLLAYDIADLSPAHAAPATPIRPVRVVPAGGPVAGMTGAAFRGRRLFISGSMRSGELGLWSIDVDADGLGKPRLEATLPVDAEAEGLDVLPTGDGLLHWLLSPFAPGGRAPTYGPGHSEIVSLVPRSASTLSLHVLRGSSRTIAVDVRLQLGDRAYPVAGAMVRAAGDRGRTDAHGSVTLHTDVARDRPVVVTAVKHQLRGRLAAPGVPARRPEFTG